MELVSLFLSILVVVFSLWLLMRKRKSNLPGPYGLPIVGYLPFMTAKPYVKLTELSKIYGPVYQLRIGTKNVVILCSFDLIKEAFHKEAFFGRPTESPFDISETSMRTGALLGLGFKEQRRFALHTLRDLGLGKTRTEEHLKEEILEVLERLSETVGTPVRIADILAPSMSNNVASFIFGKRLKFNDPKRKRLDYHLNQIGKQAGALGWQLFFPLIGAFTTKFKIGAKGRLIKSLREVKAYCMEEIEEHEATLDPNNLRDFIDGYLMEIEKRCNDLNNTFYKDVLADLARAFFSAGSETVRTTVEWVLLVCVEYPEVQKKIHAEIDEVLGRDAFPNYHHRLSLPFTEAVILETMRWKTIVPLNVMRSNIEDTELNGYFIPKDSSVLAVFWAVNHDTSLWGKDVHEFKPDRFLSLDKKKVVKPDHFTPFSTGKRSCPGKTLAEVEIFLYVAAFLQKFKISLPPGKEADLEGELGITLQPKRQELSLELR